MPRPRHLKLAAVIMSVGLAGGAQAQDAGRGETQFAVCAPCHAGDRPSGPPLAGLIGQPAGSQPGFRYSRAMKGAGFAWTDEKLDAFLADPQTLVPGNLMPFSGIDDAAQRADLIAYLKTLMPTVAAPPAGQ
jgi:cytochrome c